MDTIYQIMVFCVFYLLGLLTLAVIGASVFFIKPLRKMFNKVFIDMHTDYTNDKCN